MVMMGWGGWPVRTVGASPAASAATQRRARKEMATRAETAVSMAVRAPMVRVWLVSGKWGWGVGEMDKASEDNGEEGGEAVGGWQCTNGSEGVWVDVGWLEQLSPLSATPLYRGMRTHQAPHADACVVLPTTHAAQATPA